MWKKIFVGKIELIYTFRRVNVLYIYTYIDDKSQGIDIIILTNLMWMELLFF